MIVFYILTIVISIVCVCWSGFVIATAWTEASEENTLDNISLMEILIQICFCLCGSFIPLFNLWLLGYLIYNRNEVVEKTKTWIEIVNDLKIK